MNDPSCRVGFAFCGSFCTFHKAMDALEAVKARFGDVTPIVSENSAALDTRFPGQSRTPWPQKAAGRFGHLSLHRQHPG